MSLRRGTDASVWWLVCGVGCESGVAGSVASIGGSGGEPWWESGFELESWRSGSISDTFSRRGEIQSCVRGTLG